MTRASLATSDGTGRLESVDALRGAAALAVVLIHIPHATEQATLWLRPMLWVVDQCFEGVWLFMVISGFCIHLSAARRMGQGQPPKRRWGAFWKRRMVRLYPAYVAAIVLGLVVYYTCGPAPGDPYPIRFPIYDVASHLLMVHHMFVEYWGGVGNGLLWTLGVEEHLYALYAVYLLLRRRLGPRTVLGVVLGVFVGWVLLISWRYDLSFGSPPLHVGRLPWWAPRYWFLWCLGAVAAEVYTGAVRLPPWCWSRWTLLVLVVPLLFTHYIIASPAEVERVIGPNARYVSLATGLIHEPLFGCAAVLVLLRGVRSERAGRPPGRIGRAFAAIGVFSYSLYITHVPVIRVLETVLGTTSGDAAMVWRYATWVPVCVGFAYLFFLAIEQWFLTAPATVHLATTKQVEATLATNR